MTTRKPWSQTKLLIVEAVEAGAETTNEIYGYLGQHGYRMERSTVTAYLNKALKERAIDCTAYAFTPFCAAPVGTAQLPQAEQDALRIARRERYFGIVA